MSNFVSCNEISFYFLYKEFERGNNSVYVWLRDVVKGENYRLLFASCVYVTYTHVILCYVKCLQTNRQMMSGR